MKKIITPFWLKTVTGLSLVLALTGCQDKPTVTDPDAAMRAAGYARAPVITGIEQAGSDMVVVTGDTIPNARVRFAYGDQRAIGVTADSKGRFRAELPIGTQGGIYDLSAGDLGRLMHADGRLFIPPGMPQKAILMRPGAPSFPVVPHASQLLVADYDSAGAFALAGRVTPKTAVNLVVDGVRVRQMSDDTGYFSAIMQIPSPTQGAVVADVSVQVGDTSWTRTISVTSATGEGDRITAIPKGWRVDWMLPGGGIQTTLVF